MLHMHLQGGDIHRLGPHSMLHHVLIQVSVAKRPHTALHITLI